MRPDALGAAHYRRLACQEFDCRLPRPREVSGAHDGLTMSSPFDQLQTTLTSRGPDAALEEAARLLREQKKFHELFEVLKMTLRRQLGLPILAGSNDAGDGLNEQQRAKLE